MPGRFETEPAVGHVPSHPYSPAWAVIPGYAPNESPLWVVGSAMALIVTIVVGTAAAVASRLNPRLRRADKLIVCWFTLSGFLHIFFEGYFVLFHDTVPSRQDLFGQLWKEYTLSDSRYLTSDTFVLSIETITVTTWGPLCVATAIAITRASPLRHPLQMMTCMAHLYGVALYYLTSYTELRMKGSETSRSEFLYFWVYYVGFNFPWVVVPLWLLIRSTRTLRSAVKTLEKVQRLTSELQNKIVDLKHVRDEDEDQHSVDGRDGLGGRGKKKSE